MKLKPSRARRRGRIEIIPMIDVMFFLLATFMLASLAMQNLHSLPVNLPQGNAQSLQVANPLTLTVTREGHLMVNEEPTTLEGLGEVLRPRLTDDAGTVIVNADTDAPNGVVVQAMLAGRAAGVEKFLFAVRRK
ncbi:ExbD/TolR family protein [Telmatospirillum siberiense]|uniref:Biopolymer transporter ExbD n=1 Tax=Telmatospirillum siberiense TaxID=382514 RepID=A0A2N3Q109_9PROT|nr:biopolymer transporter ExbD [Telmatospirillum siberiense]PKU26346.1 biopolymer transporter ExbD [Telmatospirillum siberiense]